MALGKSVLTGGSASMDNTFFDESREQSVVKATIVSKYFAVWAKIIGRTVKRQGGDKIGYLDLFCGRGAYADGTPSTPIKILEQAVSDPDLSRILVAIFNDKSAANCESLKAAIQALPDIEKLKHPPSVYNEEVGATLAKTFEQMKLVPSLCFVDPWGYKGLSVKLVNALVKDWACECIFFFNYNRVNMALSNPQHAELMSELFGDYDLSLIHI